ncbi:MAG: ESPR-type extended signal peptide-containing protein [Stenotrophomonas sp.]|uniref:ESPR-type extended signal peptide-containing protein n=1 Tax=Stenotrophomonas sp. TaxID=69392 RepID=UPI003D6D6C4E
MNRIYRLVWNRTLNAFVVGSELASAQGKRSGPSKLSPAASWRLAGLGSAIALAMAGPAAATDAKLADLQDLVAKYSTTDAQQMVSAALPTVNAGVSLNASVNLPALVQVDAAAALTVKPRAAASTAGARAQLGVRAALPQLRPHASTATPAAALSVVADAALGLKPVAANANAAVTATVGPLKHNGSGLKGLANVLLPGREEGGSPLHGTLVSTVGAVKELTGEVVTGKPVAAVETLTSHATTTVASLTEHVGSTVAGVGTVLLPGKEEGGNPVRDTVTGTVGAVEALTGGVAKGTGLGGLVNGLVNGVAPVLNGVGDLLGAVVGGVTGSDTLGTGITDTVGTLTGGLKDTTGALANGDVAGTVENLLGTVDGTASTLLGATGNTLGGITGSGSGVSGVTDTLSGVIGGVTGGLSNVIGGLTGNPVTPNAAPAAPGPSGLIVGNGGLVGSVNQLVDSPLTSILGGNGYIQNGSLKVNSTNVMQAYSSLELLGTLPVVNLSPVGGVLDGLGGLTTGGNSHLTLIGGVTSDSYITHINNGDPGGLLGLVLPDGAPAWAKDCLDLLGLAQVKCWAVPAAQDYQVLIGDGAFANGSKEVVIGSNAEHRLPTQTADQVFVDANGVMTGVPTADYDARQGHSVVVGDSAKGSANAQTLLGAGATSDKANSVALGFKSNAARGGQDNYAAFGLTAAQTSIGEVAVGSAGRERQITHVAAGSQDTDAVNVMQLRGAIDQIDDLGLAAVVYDEDAAGVINYGKVTLGAGQAANGTVLANLTAGAVAAGSMEAVNGGQLFATNSAVASAIGGTMQFNNSTGQWSAPSFTITSITATGSTSQQTLGNVTDAFAAMDDSIVNVNTRIDNIQNGGAGSEYFAVNSTKAAASATGQDSMAAGPEATAGGDQTVAIGDGASASAAGSVALGAGALADRANTVSVGTAGAERQITHVADGSQDTDAVNVKQLRGAIDQIDDLGLAAVVYDEDANGVINYGKVTLGGGQAANGTVLANLAAGAVAAGSMEAVNGGQLFGLGNSMATYLGGGATFNGGVLGAPNYQINSIGVAGAASLQQFGDIGSAFTSISDSLLNLMNLPRTGPVGADPLAVQYTADGAGNPTNEVRLAGDGSGAAVALGNVANGSVATGSLDAINGGQLAATNEALASAIGGTLQYNSSTGQWSAANFTVTSINSAGTSTQQTLGNVTDALAAMDGSIVNVNNRIDNIQNGGAGNEYFAVNSTKAAASATGQDSVAAGPAATASGNQAVAIGDGANASAAGSVALGAGSVASRANTVSVGTAGAERQITNVGDGSEATDAVNVRQLQASQQGTVRYDQNTDGSTNYGSVTMGRPGTSTVIHNVGTGVAPTDAVNVAQLNKGLGDVMDWSKNYTDQRFNDVNRDIKRIDDRASAGVASAMAMAGLPQPTEAGKRMASMAASTFHGESSMAVGVSGVTDGGRWIYKLSGSANTRGDGGVTVGAGFQW